MRRLILWLMVLGSSCLLLGDDPAPILIQGGTLIPVTGKPIANGCLLIEHGRIAYIGQSISAPAGARVIDASGKFVYPGMVAPFTAIGLTNFPGSGSDVNEVGTSTPQIDPFDALNPEDDCIDVARIEGITSVLTAAGSTKVINGKALVIHLDGSLPEDMVMKRDVLQVFNLSARTENRYPSTIPGIMAFLRQKFQQVTTYMERSPATTGKEPLSRDLELEALVPVVKGEIPVLWITRDEVTIRDALMLIGEFNLKGIIFATSGIQKYADDLAARKIPVIWAGTTTMPRRWQPIDVNFRAAALLAAKGVCFAFSESTGMGSRNVRRQPLPACISVAHGLSEEEAVRALTIQPARILGIEDQMGSLEVGKRADVVICNRSLIQLSNRIDIVIVNGRIVPMTSIQTLLNDKYRKIIAERRARKGK